MSYPSTPSSNRYMIYQVFCGRWEQANIIQHPSQVFNKLATYNWAELKTALNATHVYLLGIWQNAGPIVVKSENNMDISTYENRCPSPFAITDHTVINPLLGTRDEFIRLVQTIHSAGLNVLVDFVPNHTGMAHPWLRTHPDYYKANSGHSAPVAFSGDVAELNYENPAVCKEMKAILSGIAAIGVDGVRTDMAHLIPKTFWAEAINDIQIHYPKFVLVAEAYSDSVFDLSVQEALMDAGFTAIYDEPLYRNLKASQSEHTTAGFTGHVNYILNHRENQWLHYIANHDDSFPLPQVQYELWQALVLLLPGWQLIYNGSPQGFRGRLAHHYVQLLSHTYTQVPSIPERLRVWCHWIKEEKPHCTQLKQLNDGELEASWDGTNHSGSCRFNITDNTYSWLIED